MGEHFDEGHLYVEKEVAQTHLAKPSFELLPQPRKVEGALPERLLPSVPCDLDIEELIENAFEAIILSRRVDEVEGKHRIEEAGVRIESPLLWRPE